MRKQGWRARATLTHITRFAVLALVGTLSCFGFAEDQPAHKGDGNDGFTRLELPAGYTSERRVEWYGVYVQGRKSGYAQFIRGPSDGAQQRTFEYTMNGRIQSFYDGEKLEQAFTETSLFDGRAPYGLYRSVSEQTEGGFSQKVELFRDGTKWTATVHEGGEQRTLEVEAVDFNLSDLVTAELWATSPRQPGESIRIRGFDVMELEMSIDTFEVEAIKEALADGVPTFYYVLKYSNSILGDLGTVHIDTKGNMLSWQISELIELRREPEELARNIEYSADLFVLGMARIDKALGEASGVKRLIVEAEGRVAGRLADGPRQSVEREPDGDVVVVELGPSAKWVKATADEIEENLKETVQYPINLAEIEELARSAVGDAASPKEKIARLVAFVYTYISDDYRANPLTVRDIMTHRRGDCSEHALLFATLARASGIPTREVSGLIYLGDDERAFGLHAWNEVVLDGHWVPVDPTWGEMEINATHIRLGDRNFGDVVSVVGGVIFKLRKIVREDEDR